MINALTIDVEDYFQVHAFEKVIPRSGWDAYQSRVVGNTRHVLHLLAKHNTRATFFILGWVADRYPTLVQEIAAQGHEVATHGYWHELVYRQTAPEFANDLLQSINAIKRAVAGVEIIGYRAPAFSITAQSLWALDILQDHGIRYDSSIFPLSLHDRYGIKKARRFASKMRERLWEFPANTVRFGQYNWPVAGGGYFRLYPLWVTRQAVQYLNNQERPAVIYLHPWEFDPAQPRINNASRLSRFRHYVNLNKTEQRLDKLLQEFKFTTLRDVYADVLN